MGKTAVALGDIYLEKLADSFGSIGGAWAKVDNENLVPKFSERVASMKPTPVSKSMCS
jgi:hypothetical protein